MFALDKLGPERFIVQHLKSVNPDVDPSRLRVLGYGVSRGSEESASILGENLGNRKLRKFDLVSLIDVLLARSLIDIFGRNLVGRSLDPHPHDLYQACALGHAND